MNSTRYFTLWKKKKVLFCIWLPLPGCVILDKWYITSLHLSLFVDTLSVLSTSQGCCEGQMRFCIWRYFRTIAWEYLNVKWWFFFMTFLISIVPAHETETQGSTGTDFVGQWLQVL